MLPDTSTLIMLAAASCIVVPVALVIRAAWKFADDLADDIPDWDRLADAAMPHNPPGSSPTDTTGDDVLNLLHGERN